MIKSQQQKQTKYIYPVMRFGQYASLLGLAAKDKSFDTSPESKNVETTWPLETSPPPPTHLLPKAAAFHKHDHHNHAHAHLHTKKNEQVETALHPTQQAYLAQAKAKEAAIERMGQQILAKRDGSHRPLIITNHLQDETVYPAYSSVEQSGGFKINPGSTVTVYLPAGQLDSFRSWIRRGCTEGPGENELHCLTGNCNGKLVCDGWGEYGSTAFENAIFPIGNPSGAFLDFSNVEGFTTLPMTFSMDGCDTVISCDPTGIDCPIGMQVKDENGKILACSCGYDDWNRLLEECPNGLPISDTQKALKEACPDVYSYASDDLTGQKYCPYSESNAMMIDIGNKQTDNAIASPDAVNQAVIAEVQTTSNPLPPTSPSTTTAPLVWGPDSPGWSDWIATYRWEGDK